MTHAGKANGDAIKRRHELLELIEAVEDRVWRGHGGRRHALPFADGLSLDIEKDCFEAGSSDVDGHGDGTGGFVR